MIRRPPISTRTDTLFPYTTLFRSFERVQSYIRAGDIYQANLTFPSTLPVPEDPRTLYVAIRGRAQAGHGGIVFTGAQWLLSFSPELFFTLESGRLTARPMKGTAARGIDRTSDEAAVTMLLEEIGRAHV